MDLGHDLFEEISSTQGRKKKLKEVVFFSFLIAGVQFSVM